MAPQQAIADQAFAIDNVVPLVRPAERRVIDRRITVTLFPDRYARTKKEVAIRFRDLPDAMGKRTAPTKDKLPFIKLGIFGDERSSGDCLRTNANMLAIDGIEVEHDAGTMGIDEAMELAKKNRLALIIYPTASHDPAKPRWRGFMPTSRSLSRERREVYVARAQGAFQGALAPESFTDSQAYYYGRVEGNTLYPIEIVDGRGIDEATELDSEALGRDGKPYKQRQPSPEPETGDELRGEPDWDWVKSLLEVYPVKARENYKIWLNVGQALEDASGGSEEGFQIWNEASQGDGITDCENHDENALRYKWGTFGRSKKKVTLGTIYHHAKQFGWKPRRKAGDPVFAAHELSVAEWLTRDISPPDFLLGELLSTTTRAELIAPTGVGKTNFSMALGFAVASGLDFLHWSGSGKLRRVLIIDGEMSAELIKERLRDAARRGGLPENLFVLSNEEFPDMPPLNEEAGQHYVDKVIEILGGVDLIIFDNIQALTTTGGLKDDESWGLVLPWAKKLTGRKIGQLWIHHTGRDETHGYGDSRREWQLDIVALMERATISSEADIDFRLTFTKARRRKPDNRGDFETVIITLADDRWAFKGSAQPHKNRGSPPSHQQAFGIFGELHAKGPVTPGQWRQACIASNRLSGSDNPKSHERAFERARLGLIQGNLIVIEGDMVLPFQGAFECE